jgi:xylan 1,4-beta-xylosidase
LQRIYKNTTRENLFYQGRAILSSPNANITIRADRPAGECHRFWTVMNCNRPQIFLDKEYVASMPRIKPYISQVNAVYLLGGRQPDRNVWYHGQNAAGTLRVDFDGMIAQLKSMLDHGFTPWPVLDNVPYAMSNPPQNNVFGNTAPPADERVWEQYVELALRAMVKAFGQTTVSGWWFRVGTEPDYIPGHWAGTKEQYLDHYDHTVAALNRVVPEALVGPGNILNPVEGEYGVEVHNPWGLGHHRPLREKRRPPGLVLLVVVRPGRGVVETLRPGRDPGAGTFGPLRAF